MDSGLQALAIVARLRQLPLDIGALEHQLAADRSDDPVERVLRGAIAAGFRARRIEQSLEKIDPRLLPLIARARDGEFVVLARCREEGKAGRCFLVARPGNPELETLTLASLEALCTHELILLSARNRPLAELAGRFNLRWFATAMTRHRRLFYEVLIASFLLQLFALATPLFFQVVMDKVLVHRGFSTLNVLAFGFLVVVVFEAVIGGLRGYLLGHVCNRVDIELGSRLFHHLVRLPLAYFEVRTVGQTVARVRELDTLRNFITGTALTLLVDLFFACLFILLLWYYSPLLCGIVLGSLPFYLLLSLLVTPQLRARTEASFHHGAANQSFLTEVVGGMQTVKSQALEPRMQQRWEEQLASYLKSSFQASNLNNIASQIAGLINKITTLAIIWWGAHLVIGGALSVGQLVAFNMIVGRLTAPILKLVQLWQDFQQAGISLQRLGDILSFPPEPGASATQSPCGVLRGAVSFEKVRFRHAPEAPPVFEQLNLSVAPGEVVGLVGRSGSGKSTLVKLLQALYRPQSGRITVDGLDLSLVGTSWLRRCIGVVEQDSFLFDGSVRDNIAIADPGVDFERITACSRAAGAHDFVLALPKAYDTLVGERGCHLSGGQRQRLAIARALLGDPRILILDEATSALDYESERVVQQNMAAIARDRTVFIIAHRLSTVRHCDRIYVLGDGAIEESGSHEELLAANGRYASLYGHQSEHPAIRTGRRDVSARDALTSTTAAARGKIS